MHFEIYHFLLLFLFSEFYSVRAVTETFVFVPSVRKPTQSNNIFVVIVVIVIIIHNQMNVKQNKKKQIFKIQKKNMLSRVKKALSRLLFIYLCVHMHVSSVFVSSVYILFILIHSVNISNSMYARNMRRWDPMRYDCAQIIIKNMFKCLNVQMFWPTPEFI